MSSKSGSGAQRLAAPHLALLLRILIVLIGLFTAGMPVSAEDVPAQPASTLSAEEMDRIVKAARDAVLRELATTPIPSGRIAEQAVPVVQPTTAGGEGDFNVLTDKKLFAVSEKLVEAVQAFPMLWSKVGRIAGRLDESTGPTPWFRHPLLLTLLGLVFGAWAVRSVAKWIQSRWLPARESIEQWSLRETAMLAVIDVAGWCVYWVVCRYVSGAVFSDQSMGSTVGQWLLWQGPRFFLYLTAIGICFRPKLKVARIAPLDDTDARLASQLFIVIAAVMAIRTWVLILSADNVTESTLAAALLLNNLLFVSTTFWAAFRSRHAIARWIRNDGSEQGIVSPFRDFVADHWIVFAGILVVLLSFGHLYGALSGRVEVSWGLTITLRTLLLVIFAASLVRFVARRLEAASATESDSTSKPRLSTPLARVIRLLILLGTLYWLAWLWLVYSLGIISSENWQNANARLLQPALVLVFGLIAWTAIKFGTASYLARHSSSTGTGNLVQNSSRLRTLIPLIRLALGIALFVLITLVALSSLGVNITPLLAGASVAGLAISFGSQALVKDIVSGFFFLADDAFRVGEYINCGNVKGTVEGFTLRSVRLRHQSGQVHTVPFGQLGEITNFSRDWASVKFNINLDRDVDLDRVRIITKEVGKNLQADPELSASLLSPLKFQGIASITDNAVVARFKFMARPTNPSEIERAAKRQLLYRFREENIKLASQPLASSFSRSADAL